MALAQPPYDLWFAFLIAGPVCFWLWSAARGRSAAAAFWTGWAVGVGHFAVAVHWIAEPFLVDAAAHGWMAPFAVVIVCGGLALFWGAAWWAAMRVAARFPSASAWREALLLAIAWTLAEFVRASIFTGFPWAMAVYGWMETPVAQAGALIGPYAITALTLAAMLLLGAAGRWAAPPLAGLAIIAAGWTYGAARLSSDAAQAAPGGPLIRTVQTNVDPNAKWAPDNVRANLDMLLALSTAEGGEPPAVTVWPESAVTFVLDKSPNATKEIADRLGGAEIATGALRLDAGPEAEIEPGALWRNSMFLIDATGALSRPFDKIHLVPFGEYLPFDRFFNALGVLGFGSLGGGIVPGDAPVLMRPANAPPFAPLICYEMIFPRETANAADGADWMALATNDAWFGARVGPIQHLAKARMRAIETGRPIARSANAGVSAIIDPYGRIPGAIGPGRSGAVDSRLPARVATPYFAFGEIVTTLVLGVFTVLTTYGRKFRT